MTQDIKETLTRIEQGNHEIAAAIAAQNNLARLTITRLNEIVALLTPKDNPDEPSLSDLLAHMIAQQREQLVLTRRLVDLTLDIPEHLPAKLVEALEAHFSSLAKV